MVAASDLPTMAQEVIGRWTDISNPFLFQEANYLCLYETAFDSGELPAETN